MAKKKQRKKRKYTQRSIRKIGQEVHAAVLDGKKPKSPIAQKMAENLQTAQAVSNVDFEEETITITISKQRAINLRGQLSDFLCWRDGFLTGRDHGGGFGDRLAPLKNGADAAEYFFHRLSSSL